MQCVLKRRAADKVKGTSGNPTASEWGIKKHNKINPAVDHKTYLRARFR